VSERNKQQKKKNQSLISTINKQAHKHFFFLEKHFKSAREQEKLSRYHRKEREGEFIGFVYQLIILPLSATGSGRESNNGFARHTRML
jgi:hypothetical protein